MSEVCSNCGEFFKAATVPSAGLSEVYHGTDENGAESLLELQTFDRSMLQRRDEGFFGEGFYCGTKPFVAEMYGSVVLAVSLRSSASILDAGGSLKPNRRPSWHDGFRKYQLSLIREAWPDRDPARLFEPLDPESPRFDHRDWHRSVTAWAEETGWDGIRWEREVVVFDPDAVMGISRT